MATNKVIYNNQTLIDLTNDTVNSNNLLLGETAHDRSGNQIEGRYVPESLPMDLIYGLYLNDEEPFSNDSVTSFNADGSIQTNFSNGYYLITSFPSDGTIVKTLYNDSDEALKTSTTSFLSDGSIERMIT